MSILTSLLIALIAVNGSNISLNDLNIDKSHYFADLEKAKTNQNDYCLSFIDNLERQNKIEDCTNITVLTHGLGSSYRDWLPLYEKNGDVDKDCFSLENFSLPFLLSNLVNKTEDELINKPYTSVYLFSPKQTDVFPSDTKISQMVYKVDKKYFKFDSIGSIETMDINESNIVLLYDNQEQGNFDIEYTNDDCANRFELSLSNVLCQIYNAQLGNLGKINLIGHSKGGITNLLFSTRHPKLVNNLISLGTPYNGSSWAKVIQNIKKLGCYAEGDFEANTTYDDLLNPDHPNEYSALFNQKCSNVNSYALGFNMDSTSLIFSIASYATYREDTNNKNLFECAKGIRDIRFASLIDPMSRSFIGDFGEGPFLDILENFCETFLEFGAHSLIGLTEEAIRSLINSLVNALMGTTIELKIFFEAAKVLSDCGKYIADKFGGDENTDRGNKVIHTLVDLMDAILGVFNTCDINDIDDFVAIDSDVCVDTDSQIGKYLGSSLYDFDNRKVLTIKVLSSNFYYDLKHCARPGETAVPHNFETKNPDAVDNIMEYLNDHDGLNAYFSLNSVDLSKSFRPAIFANDEIEMTDAFFTKSTIEPNDYGYPDYYCYESEINYNPSFGQTTFTVDGTQISTNRLRTGYIQSEKIVLSPDRNNAGCAYIEYTFDKPIYAIDVDLSMWSANENLSQNNEVFYFTSNSTTMNAIKSEKLYNLFSSNTNNTPMRGLIYGNIENRFLAATELAVLSPGLILSNQTQFDYYCEAIKGLIEGQKFNLNEFSTDRNNQDYYRIAFDEPSNTFGFYAAVQNITSGSKNKGRICIGDMTVYA